MPGKGLYSGNPMNRRTTLLMFAALAAAQPAQADAGASLAQAAFDRPIGRDLTTLGRMELVDRGRAPRVRELITYRVDRGRGETAYLVRFLEPRDIAGTGLLSLNRVDGSNEQSLYLPELDRVRRIAGDRKGGRFVGSDLYYEDLQERKPARDRHRLIGRETVNGIACEILESTPLDAADSVYLKRISWIDPQTLLAYRIDYFERDPAAPSKRWELLAHKRIQGYWTATDSRVTDLNTGHSTRLTVEKAVYDRRLPAKLFTPQALADEALESEYRP
ncbi:MAG: outer membrane lipoprotein-sorting protein [Rubrivivax sp.]|nr:outer membrane lipoprotein-sorting protein [Rubrivivax sp.]